MTMSIRKVSAGHGYAYLLRSVARGDGDRAAPDRVTRYYLEAGTPPGFWLGSAVADLARGGFALQEGDLVTEEQLKRLVGAGRNPLNGSPLGRDYAEYKPAVQRIAERIADLDPNLSEVERACAVAVIESEEYRAGDKHAVAGFDLTFSVPKSVSVLWAMADANTQARIVEAHHAAVRETLDLLERHVGATRRGVQGIEQADISGLIVAAFDHWDSRSNDPQLHTHAVVSNRVRTIVDGVWRTLDAQPLFAATVALSAHYDALLRDRLTATFGVGWELRGRGADRTLQWEIAGISEDLIEEFSSRSAQINACTDELIDDYVASHGRRPTRTMIGRLRARATLATRPEKVLHSLHDLTNAWRRRAATLVPDGDPVGLARRLTTQGAAPVFRADDAPAEAVEKAAAQTLAVVSDKKSVWTHWNLWAEASRQTLGWRFATAHDREGVTARIVDLAEAGSIPLTPDELAPTPPVLQRENGTSRLRPRHHRVFTSVEVWDAEQRLLDLADDLRAPAVSLNEIAAAVGRPDRGRDLTAEQARAVAAVARSRRTVDLLVGPAGAGKTTTMRALVRAWTGAHGRQSVIGLAPSAAAAKVLGHDIRLRAETTAKLLHETAQGPIRLSRGQLVIVDEATLAGTRTLTAIADATHAAGAKLLLVGDPAQLQAVDAGGAFRMLVHARPDAPTLTDIHRFVHMWEKEASKSLRAGLPEAVAAYDDHGRIHEGAHDEALDAAYTAWALDLEGGRASVLIADAAATVADLNRRARADRILAGLVDPRRAVALAHGPEASPGDIVITRRNARGLVTLRGGFVRNGDRWQITGVRRDGAVEARRLKSTAGRVRLGSAVVLPARYVVDHLDLGYAVTAHRAQGLTVDTGHVVVTAKTARENLYVALTRGRYANHAYVATDLPDDDHTPPAEAATARAILYRVLARTGAELSAHETLREEREKWASRERLITEYEHLADHAQRPRWTRLILGALTGAGRLTEDEAATAITSDAFGPLCRELRRAEAHGHDVERALPAVAAHGTLLGADDVCAVLKHRLARATSNPVPGRVRILPGGIPQAAGPMPDDERAALDARAGSLGPLPGPPARTTTTTGPCL
ncbi:relaxase domain-containing protein [Antribacter sp. KLBMP9083]|uniref:Relaxase domain-containing protein n=1 Tax=Antribacter soli TaxID=2910976 RepID=A0AA41U908_9MICO|nr:MobF family relaxase [Antribacter soli]MCF4123015.1 relaxase domain-containing protein [Antribacter soli]